MKTRLKNVVGIAVIATAGLVVLALGKGFPSESPRVIGPTAEVVEVSTGATYVARVDTGAAVTSLHCLEEDVVISDASDDPHENVGKSARIRVCGIEGDSRWVETKLIDYVEVRSANGSEYRYRVRLPLCHDGVCKETIVNLNDRSRMTYRMLLGRDFLAGDFLVDVGREGS